MAKKKDRVPTLGELLVAANRADWQQVVLNGGPPCFHFDAKRGKFCLAAERWAGHGELHPFSNLADLIGNSVYNANLAVIEAASGTKKRAATKQPKRSEQRRPLRAKRK